MVLRVLLADDEPMVRGGARMMLEADGHVIVGEASDGEQAVRMARELRPDVVLMDIRMPVLDGIRATELLAGPRVADPMAVLVVTTFDLDENVHAALRAGARGFVLKTAGPRLLQEAVRAAADGESLISPSVTTRLLEHFANPAPDRSPELPRPLTPRETDVVLAVASGLTNAEIAEKFVIGVTTVKVHLAAAQRKTGSRNRTEVAIWAWETGLARR